jgi:hypothetical protein
MIGFRAVFFESGIKMTVLRAVYVTAAVLLVMAVVALGGAFMLTRSDRGAASRDAWEGFVEPQQQLGQQPQQPQPQQAQPQLGQQPQLQPGVQVAPEPEMDVASAVAIAAAYKSVYKMDPGVEEVKVANRAMRAAGTAVTAASAEAYLRGRLAGAVGVAALGATASGAAPSGDTACGRVFLRGLEAEMEAIVNRLDRVLDSVNARVAMTSGRGGGPGALVTDRPLAGAADRRRRATSEPGTLASLASSAAEGAARAASILTGPLPPTTTLTGSGPAAPRAVEGFYQPWGRGHGGSAGGGGTEGWSDSEDEGYHR